MIDTADSVEASRGLIVARCALARRMMHECASLNVRRATQWSAQVCHWLHGLGGRGAGVLVSLSLCPPPMAKPRLAWACSPSTHVPTTCGGWWGIDHRTTQPPAKYLRALVSGTAAETTIRSPGR